MLHYPFFLHQAFNLFQCDICFNGIQDGSHSPLSLTCGHIFGKKYVS